jgi:3-oxoacyl-[acyl-carrier-protein] synthase II
VRIVVTGVGAVSALGGSARALWEAILAGRSGLATAQQNLLAAPVGEVRDEWIDDNCCGDAGLTRTESLAMSAARQAIECAGIDLGDVDRVGIVFGMCQAAPESDHTQAWRVQRCADQLADGLGVRGPRLTIASACTAGAAAIGVGLELMRSGHCDVVVAGGADALNSATAQGFAGTRSIDERPCSPYGRSEGLSLGEGAGFVVLESADAADQRGREPVCHISGWGVSADAYHPTAPDPTGGGLLRAIETALADAGIEPADLDYVNGHGTGTGPNDAMEMQAFQRLAAAAGHPMDVSSLKGAIGHTLGAAGAIEAIVTAMAVRDQVLPPNVGGGTDSGTPSVRIVAEPTKVALRAAASANAAFGGNNSALVLSSGDGHRDPPSPRGIRIAASSHLVPGDAAQRPREVPAGQWRRMDDLSRRCVAAVAAALSRTSAAPGSAALESAALWYCTTWGPVGAIDGYARSIQSGRINPMHFANAAMCAAPGHIGMGLGIAGPTMTIASGGVGSVASLGLASSLISRGRTDLAVVVGADEGRIDPNGETVVWDEPAEVAAIVLVRHEGSAPTPTVDFVPPTVSEQGTITTRPAVEPLAQLHRSIQNDGDRVASVLGWCRGGYSASTCMTATASEPGT